MTDAAQCAKVLSLVQRGVADGASLMCGGRRVAGRRGYFVAPAVFAGVEDHHSVAVEEVPK